LHRAIRQLLRVRRNAPLISYFDIIACMIITDRIYGKIEITNPLIVELINSKPFQRLKHISQDGASHFLQPFRDVTRYEHCIGAWYLSEKFNRPIEEQIASLLHDLPHTAFSHVIDFVVENKKHEYHDHFIKEVIVHSEIPEILKKHKVSLEKTLNKEDFYLLNNNLPDISFDRWDYFMRDGFNGSLLPKETVELFLTSIFEKNERFYFTDVRVANLFTIMFMNCSRLLWLDPASHGAFFLLSNAIKIALNKSYITKKDFFDTDAGLMQKLVDAKDSEIDALLQRLKPTTQFEYASIDEAEFYGSNKPRFVNPWIMRDGKLVQLSTITPGLQQYFDDFSKQHKNLGVKQITS
jgi:HD superfamily phosphohydrolase